MMRRGPSLSSKMNSMFGRSMFAIVRILEPIRLSRLDVEYVFTCESTDAPEKDGIVRCCMYLEAGDC